MKLSFLHGFMGHPSDWDEVRAAFDDQESIAVELKPSADWESSLQQLRATLPDRSVLVGYSMGARLALGLALDAPDRCAGLVFISGNPGLESTAERQRRNVADQQLADRIATEPLGPFLTAWYDAPVFKGVSQRIKDFEVKQKQARDGTDWPAILRANSVAKQPNYWPRLKELSVPVLVLSGECDEKYSKIAQRFEQEASSSDVTSRILSNCGHIVHREKPNEFAELLRTFIGRVA